MRLGEAMLKDGGERPSILADALEAVFGAVFVDAGFDAARRVVERVYAAEFARVDPTTLDKDPKTRLQEWLQARRFAVPEYVVTATAGEAHAQTMTVECRIPALSHRHAPVRAPIVGPRSRSPPRRPTCGSRPPRATRVATDAPNAADFRCGYVAIAGRPNVGKSTLLNRLVGERVSITSKKAQTTRHRVTGIVTRADGQILFVDTPGFQTKHRSRLNDRMNRAVTQCLADVDAVVVVIEAGRITEADRAVIGLLPTDARAVAALNKIDRMKDRDALLPQMAELAALFPFAAIVPVSAEKGVALDALLAEVRALLPVAPAVYGRGRDHRSRRAFSRRRVRAREDLPAAGRGSAVRDDGDDRQLRARGRAPPDPRHDPRRPRKPARASCVGAGGERMKEIATAARADMERLFGGQVYLEVWVKVTRGWAEDEAPVEAIRLLRWMRPTQSPMAPRAQPQRRDDEPAFVLHTFAYRETSVIVEAITAEYGRVAMVARGARRPRSELRGLLQGFQPLLLSWSGQHELKTLLHAEWRGGLPRVGGSALVCGFYLNELLLKLLPREDPHPRLFASYEAALADLAAGGEQAPDPAALRAPAARRAGLRAAARARGRHRRADRSGGAIPLRLRSRRAPRAAGSDGAAADRARVRRCWRWPTAATPMPKPRPRRSG